MKKYLYLIKKSKIKSWLKFWLLTNNKFNSILSEILEGFTFNLQNTVKRYFNIFQIFGNSEQATRSGTNYFDASQIQYSSIVVTENGKTITLPIASSGNGNVNTGAFLKDLCPNLDVGDVVYLKFTRNVNPNSNNFIYLYNSSASPSSIEWGNGFSKTITQDLLNSYVILYGNRAQDGETQQVILTDFRIVKNATDEWEQYGVSPSPNYPSEIHSVADDVNLFDENYYLTLPNDNWYDITSYFGYVKLPDTFKTKFTGKMHLKGTSQNLVLAIIDNPPYVPAETRLLNGGTLTEITYDYTNSSNVYLAIGNSSGINLQRDIKLILDNYGTKLQQGTTATTYSPYGQGTLTETIEGTQNSYDYTFQTEPLRSLPNGVRDSLEDDGIHRRVGRVVLDGTQHIEIVNWRPTETSVGWVYPRSITNNKKQTEGVINNILCNKLKVVSYSNLFGNTVDEGINIVTQSNAYGIVIKTKDTSLTTTNAINTYLSSNPITVQYELEEEIIEPYTEEQQAEYDKIKELYTFDGTTNISSDDEVPPYLQIQYYMKGE